MRHLDTRKVVCMGCFSKCQKYTIDSSDTLKERVNKHILKDLNINDIRIPVGLCERCRVRLAKIEAGKFSEFDVLSVRQQRH